MGWSAVSDSRRASEADSSRGSSAIRVTSSPSVDSSPPGSGRRAVRTTQGRSAAARTRSRTMSALDSSMRSQPSNSRSVGPSRAARSRSSTTCESFAGRNRSSRSRSSSFSGIEKPSTVARRGAHVSRSGACCRMASIRAVSSSAGVAAGLASITSRSSRRIAWCAAAPPNRPLAPRRTSRSGSTSQSPVMREDLPRPASATSSTQRPRPALASSTAARRMPSSCSRPCRPAVPDTVEIAWSSDVDRTSAAWIGRDLPLTRKGGTSEATIAEPDRLTTSRTARTWPGSDLPMTRAATLMASPLTENVRRKAGPKSEANTRPRFTPTRSGSRRPGPRRGASLVSIRRSTSRRPGSSRDEHDLAAIPVDVALEERHALRRARRLRVAHDVVQRIRQGAWSLRADEGVGPENWMKATARLRCSDSPAAARRWSRTGVG